MWTARKARAYPTPEQEALLSRTLGCARFVWNEILAARHARYMTSGQQTSYAQASRELTALKQRPGMEFLNEVSSVALQQSIRNQQAAFAGFFAKRARYPRFKARRGREAVTFVGRAMRIDEGGRLWLPKMDRPLKLAWSFDVRPQDIDVTRVVVAREADGTWHATLCSEEDVPALPETGESVGIDVGLTTFATLSTGEAVEQPNFYAQHARKVARYQRMVARREKGSANREKARRKLTRTYAKRTHQQHDWLHKTSTELVRRFDVIAVEDINFSDMRRGWRRLRPTLQRSSHGLFRDMLRYKSERYGRRFVVIDRWYPSSKTCSDCGHLVANLGLDTRRWQCPQCGARHDRDINAAKNILTVGQTVSACGDSVRPVGATPGQRSAKQEPERVGTPK